jgi:UDP-glucose 4-epimerase
MFYNKVFKVPYIIFRFSSVYGIGREAGPINKIVSDAVKHGEVTVYGNGSQTRDFTHITDVLSAFNLVLENKLPMNDVYNVGTGRETSVNQILKLLMEFGIGFIVRREPMQKGDLLRSCQDISRICAFGYKPSVSIKDGITELIKHYKKGG